MRLEQSEAPGDIQRRSSRRETGKFVLHHFHETLIHQRDHYIYLLRDPRDKSVRYVGSTVNPKRRYSAHLNDKCDGSYIRVRWNWISELHAMNVRPEMEIVETLPAPIAEALVSEREFRWMFHFFQQGANLTNVDCVRMPRLYCAGRALAIDFLKEPLESPVWEELALLKVKGHSEWRRINRELDAMKQRRSKPQKRKVLKLPRRANHLSEGRSHESN